MTDRVPIFVELCAGTAALSLRLEHPRARPPVSRMGAKTGYADVILRCMGLRPGQGAHRYLWCEPDAGVRLLLHAYRDRELATAAADIIRGWQDEEPRALWERLRAEGPAQCPPVDAREVAKFLRLLTSNRLIPGTWSTDGRWVNPPRDGGVHTDGGVAFGGADFCTDTGALSIAVAGVPTLPATIADDARKVDPREVARCLQIIASNELINLDSRTWKNTGQGGSTFGGAIGYGADRMLRKLEAAPTLPATIADDARTVDPREVARWSWLWVRSVAFKGPSAGYMPGDAEDGSGRWVNRPQGVALKWDTAPTLPATITDDARKVEPPQLPPGVVVYIDPPYQNTTGYAHAFPRSEWVPIVRRWKEAGAMVVVSEAEPIPELMADGWHAVRIDGERKGQKRTFSKQQAEWLTMSEPPRWRPSVQMGLWSRGSDNGATCGNT